MTVTSLLLPRLPGRCIRALAGLTATAAPAGQRARPLHTSVAMRTAVFRRAVGFAANTALRDRHAEYTYAGLWRCSRLLADKVSESLEGRRGQRVAFLCPNDASYVMALWACWISGQIAVPLSPLHPESSLKYFVEDSGAGLLMATPSTATRLAPLAAGPDSAASAPTLLLIGDDLRAAAAADADPSACRRGGAESRIWRSRTTSSPGRTFLLRRARRGGPRGRRERRRRRRRHDHLHVRDHQPSKGRAAESR